MARQSTHSTPLRHILGIKIRIVVKPSIFIILNDLIHLNRIPVGVHSILIHFLIMRWQSLLAQIEVSLLAIKFIQQFIAATEQMVKEHCKMVILWEPEAVSSQTFVSPINSCPSHSMA
jgi:hypothetical protein